MAEVESNPATSFLDRFIDAAGSAFTLKLLASAQTDALRYQLAQNQALIDAERRQAVQVPQTSMIAGIPTPMILFGVAGLVVFLIANK